MIILGSGVPHKKNYLCIKVIHSITSNMFHLKEKVESNQNELKVRLSNCFNSEIIARLNQSEDVKIKKIKINK